MAHVLIVGGFLIAAWGAVSFARAVMDAARTRPATQTAGTIWPGPM